MIYIFRKEIKKWSYVWWVILASFAIGAVPTYIFFKGTSPREIQVATVNGSAIYLKDLQIQVAQVQTQIDNLRAQAQKYGFSPDMFLTQFGFNDPQKLAMDRLIDDKLVESVASELHMDLSKEFLLNEIVKTVPKFFIDKDGRVNERMFGQYLKHAKLSIEEFERMKEEELKQELVKDFVKAAAYVSTTNIKEEFDRNNSKKSFLILPIYFDKFTSAAQKEKASDEEIAKFYEARKEAYRMPQKREIKFWTFGIEPYFSDVSVDDDEIKVFYEKNRATQFLDSKTGKIKSLESAQADILKTLKAKKATDNLKADLDGIITQMQSDQNAIDEFAKNKNLKEEKRVLSQRDVQVDPKYGPFAHKLFAEKPSTLNFGYLNIEGKHVVYKESYRIESQVPPLEVLRDIIAVELYKFKAQQAIRDYVTKAQASILDGVKKLEDYAQELGVKIINTGLVKKDGSKIAGIQQADDILERAFYLKSQSQVLKHAQQPNYYLIQLDKVEQANLDEFEKVKESLKSTQASAAQRDVEMAFAKALVRVARIDKVELPKIEQPVPDEFES